MDTDNKRMCPMCKKVKEVSEFYYCKNGKRYDTYCKECRRIYNRSYARARYELKHDHILALNKKYYQRKKERKHAE